MTLEQLRSKLQKAVTGTAFEGRIYFAGGAVRDFLLQKNSLDIDITVEMENGGILLAEYIASKWKLGKPVVYKQFGTALLNYKRHKLEFVMTRAESYRHKDRKPQVVFADLEHDVMRRDFTINALIMDIKSAEILDLCGRGIQDLRNGVIRCAGNPGIVFEEDPLRILRAIRFATRFGFRIEEETYATLCTKACFLEHISWQRISAEINQILLCNNFESGLKLLKRTGVLGVVLPELSSLCMESMDVGKRLNGWDHTLEVVTNTKCDLTLRWTALLHEVGKDVTISDHRIGIHQDKNEKNSAKIAEVVLKRMMLPNAKIKCIIWAIANQNVLKQSSKGTLQDSDKAIRKLAWEDPSRVDLLLELMHAVLSTNSSADKHRNQTHDLRMKVLKYREIAQNLRFVLTGKDLIDDFCIQPGPWVGKLLILARDKWLENPQLTPEELKDYLKTRINDI